MRYILIRWIILVIAVWITTWLLPGVHVHGGISSFIIIAAVLGLVNAIIRPIIMFFTCPLIMLTLGLFILIVNTMMLSLTAWLLPEMLTIDGFWSTFFASLIISIISAILSIYLHGDKPKDNVIVYK